MANTSSVKKVFLLADIGVGENNSYHVGDEAMFLQNLCNYQSVGIKISGSSRSISHQSLDFNEVLDIYITNVPMLLYLVFCVYSLRYSGLNFFPRFFRKTVKELISSDLLHISGGGNLNSFWPGHIYYRFLMITLANVFDKDVILTSQTIGPITNGFHGFLLSRCFEKVKMIEVRDSVYSKGVLIGLGVDKSKIKNVIDDGYDFKMNTDKKIGQLIFNKFPNSKGEIKIGVSMHKWSNSQNLDALKRVFTELIENYPKAYFFVIPHNFDDKDGLDIEFMTRLIGRDVKRMGLFNYKAIDSLIKRTKLTPAEIIKLVTANMDFVISSRYHGLVFALASNVPALVINYDKYYSIKNDGLLKNFFDNIEPYTVSFNKVEETLSKTRNIIKNCENIANQLKTKNTILFKKYENKFDQNY